MGSREERGWRGLSVRWNKVSRTLDRSAEFGKVHGRGWRVQGRGPGISDVDSSAWPDVQPHFRPTDESSADD